MIKIEVNGIIIYRADNDGNKVRFVGDDRLYSEISVDSEDTRQVEEVNDGHI